MGYGLAEEVAASRPVRPGPEWWTLLDLAQSARDDTRVAWPGEEYLLERAGCSRATLYRRIAVLEEQKLIAVTRTGRAHRTEYTILPMPGSATEALAASLESHHAETPSHADDPPAGVSADSLESQHGETPNGSYSQVGVSKQLHGVSESEFGVSGMRETPPVSTPVKPLPSNSSGPVVTTSVEGETPPRGQDQSVIHTPETTRCAQCGGLDSLDQITRAGACQWCRPAAPSKPAA